MRWSIRFQLLVPLFMLLLGVIGMSVWTALASADRARRQIEKQMHDIARTVAAIPPPNQHTLPLMKGLSGAEFLPCDTQGEPLHDDEGRALTTLPELPDKLPGTTPRWESLTELPRVQVAGRAYFALGVPIGSGAELRGTLYVLYPESLWRDAVWEAVRPSLYVGIIGGLASLVLAVAVAQRLSRRFRELERRTRLIAAGDFSPMPLPRRNDELRDLARSVNEMAQQLAQYQEAVKHTERLRLLGQVSGGLAHQLRNGVTGAKLAVQLHARACNAKADAESLDVALRQLTLVETHLKRFLDLGKASELRRQPCDLRALLAETIALLQPQCRHARIARRWQPMENAEPAIVSGDRGQLGHLFLNVLTNAMEAAGPGGTVEAELRVRANSAKVSISDSGPGPAPDLAARLFEPFVTGKPEGVGLGLAVARQVVEAHGGAIGWRRDQGRTRFEIELPLVGQGSNPALDLGGSGVLSHGSPA